MQIKAMHTAEDNGAVFHQAAAVQLTTVSTHHEQVTEPWNRALWAAKTGLDAQQTQMTVIANNLANVNTTGFKKSRAVFEDLLYQNVRQVGADTSQSTPVAHRPQLGTGVRVVATEKNYTQGSVNQTGNSLDLAIKGRGFFQVLHADGTLAYTRDGSFQTNATGPAGHRQPATVLQPAHHHPGGRAERHGRQRRHGQRAAGRTDRAETVGTLQLADFINPAGLQAIGQNLLGRVRLQRHRADRQRRA